MKKKIIFPFIFAIIFVFVAIFGGYFFYKNKKEKDIIKSRDEIRLESLKNLETFLKIFKEKKGFYPSEKNDLQNILEKIHPENIKNCFQSECGIIYAVTLDGKFYEISTAFEDKNFLKKMQNEEKFGNDENRYEITNIKEKNKNLYTRFDDIQNTQKNILNKKEKIFLIKNKEIINLNNPKKEETKKKNNILYDEKSKKLRDEKRVRKIHELQTALVQFYLEKNFFPYDEESFKDFQKDFNINFEDEKIEKCIGGPCEIVYKTDETKQFYEISTAFETYENIESKAKNDNGNDNTRLELTNIIEKENNLDTSLRENDIISKNTKNESLTFVLGKEIKSVIKNSSKDDFSQREENKNAMIRDAKRKKDFEKLNEKIQNFYNQTGKYLTNEEEIKGELLGNWYELKPEDYEECKNCSFKYFVTKDGVYYELNMDFETNIYTKLKKEDKGNDDLFYELGNELFLNGENKDFSENSENEKNKNSEEIKEENNFKNNILSFDINYKNIVKVENN